MLATPFDALACFIPKAREFDAMLEPEGLEEGSVAPGDLEVGILEDAPDNPTQAELAAALEDLNDDEIVEVLALVLLGQGDHDAGEWRDSLADARDAHDGRAVRYLLATPTLGDLLV